MTVHEDYPHVIVVTYGNSSAVRSCLESLRRNASKLGRVMIVDNQSPDTTPDMIERDFPEFYLIRNTENAGFSKANNLALRALPEDARPILFLNPDCELLPDTIPLTATALRQDDKIGLVGCRLIRSDGSFDHASKRMIPTPKEALRYLLRKRWPLSSAPSEYVAPHLGETDTGGVDAVNGAFMLARRSAIREVGELDERFWMYGEDLDYCVRFREAGWVVQYHGNATAIHLKGASSDGRRSTKLNYEFHRSMSLFYRKHLAKKNNWIVNAGVTAAIWARFVALESLNRTAALVK